MRRSLIAVGLIAAALAPIVVAAPAGSQTTPAPIVRVDTWNSVPAGPLDLSGDWQLKPHASSTFRYPPAIVLEGAQRVLRLRTDRETISLWRMVPADLRHTPRLVWEWKVLALPSGGDVRQPGRNDQAARVVVLFQGWKSIAYIWDTQAPVGTEVRPDEFGPVDRVLVVIRSGSARLGQWHREERDVGADYRRLFGEAPPQVKLVSVESHSDDVESQSDALFGPIRFQK